MLPNAPENKALAKPGPSLSENERALADNNAAILKGRNALFAEWKFLQDLTFKAAGLLESIGDIETAEDVRAAVRGSAERIGAETAPPNRG